jgi:hypothetical protein
MDNTCARTAGQLKIYRIYSGEVIIFLLSFKLNAWNLDFIAGFDKEGGSIRSLIVVLAGSCFNV